MDYLAKRKQEILEAMESCRAGSDDLSTPELSELAASLAVDAELRERLQRVQQADRAIKAAFQDVPVPTGLADRISRRLAEATAAQSPVEANPDLPVPLSKDSTPAQPQRFSRRRLLVGFAALSAAASLLVAVWLETHRPADKPRHSVLEEAMDFFNHDNEPLGELVSRVSPPADFPISRDLNPDFFRQREIRWRSVESFLGSPAVAYDLPVRGGRATLYVVNRTVPGLPSLPPTMPPYSTGGNSAGAWQTETTLYVLVVEGDAGTYSYCLANRQIV
jgi:hypothetical protein